MDDGKPFRKQTEPRAGLVEVLAFIALVAVVVLGVLQAHEIGPPAKIVAAGER